MFNVSSCHASVPTHSRALLHPIHPSDAPIRVSLANTALNRPAHCQPTSNGCIRRWRSYQAVKGSMHIRMIMIHQMTCSIRTHVLSMLQSPREQCSAVIERSSHSEGAHSVRKSVERRRVGAQRVPSHCRSASVRSRASRCPQASSAARESATARRRVELRLEGHSGRACRPSDTAGVAWTHSPVRMSMNSLARHRSSAERIVSPLCSETELSSSEAERQA
jgi:hypothetical protein